MLLVSIWWHFSIPVDILRQGIRLIFTAYFRTPTVLNLYKGKKKNNGFRQSVSWYCVGKLSLVYVTETELTHRRRQVSLNVKFDDRITWAGSTAPPAVCGGNVNSLFLNSLFFILIPLSGKCNTFIIIDSGLLTEFSTLHFPRYYCCWSNVALYVLYYVHTVLYLPVRGQAIRRACFSDNT